MISLGLGLDSVEKLLDSYDYSSVRDIVKRVEKEKRYTRGLFKNDLLETIEGIRLAYYSIMTKNGSRPFKRFYRSAQKDIKKLLGYKEATVWDSLKKSKRI